MKIPNKVSILGEEFKVIRQEKIDHFPNAAGLCDVDNKKIIILKSLPDKEAKMVFIHEVVHAVVGCGGVYQVLSHELEEVLCDQISRTLAKLI